MFCNIKNFWYQRHAYTSLLYHWGLKYKCPFCGFHAKDLLPIGMDNKATYKYKIIGAGKRNAGCPKCGSTDRERLIYTYLNFKLDIFNKPTTRILHIAPEIIIMQNFIAKGFTNYICGDFFAEGQHADYSHNLVKHMDIQNLPYDDNSFDLVICNHVLEHVPNDSKAMEEIYRVLDKNGKAILQVPISPVLKETISDTSISDSKTREEKFGQRDHVRLFGTDYTSKLQSTGFTVTTLKLQSEYPKFGFNPKEVLYIGRK